MNDHIVLDAKDQTIKCLHCGASEPLKLPMEIGEMVEWAEKWADKHKRCYCIACQWSGYDEEMYKAFGCPSCTCRKL